MDAHYLFNFVASYKEAAEWSSTHRETEDGDDVPIDSLCLDWDKSADDSANEWCRSFINDNLADLESCGLSADSAGHDFWLTSAGHGAGFGDRGLGDVGHRLSKASKPYAADLYVGDDRKLYLS